MMKKIFLIIILSLFFGCVYIYSEIEYRVKKIENPNYIFDKYTIKSEKDGLEIFLKISSDFKNMKVYFYDLKEVETEEYEVNKKILNDVNIILKDKKNIIKKEKIVYKIKKNYRNKDYLETILTFSEPLDGKIIVEFGHVRIGKKKFLIPPIVMQKYKESYSDSTIRAILNEGGEVFKPIYRKEEWVE